MITKRFSNFIMAAVSTLIISLPNVVSAAPAPYPITVNSQVLEAPAITASEAEAKTYRVSFKDGALPSDVSVSIPSMTYAVSNISGIGYFTSSWAFVDGGTGGVVDFTFTASNMNNDPTTYVYRVGTTLSTYKIGRLTIDPNFFASGIPLPEPTTNMNWAGSTHINQPWIESVVMSEGTNNFITTNGTEITIGFKTDYADGSGNIGAVTNDPISIFQNDLDFQTSTQVAAAVVAGQVGASNSFVKKSGDTMTGGLITPYVQVSIEGLRLVDEDFYHTNAISSSVDLPYWGTDTGVSRIMLYSDMILTESRTITGTNTVLLSVNQTNGSFVSFQQGPTAKGQLVMYDASSTSKIYLDANDTNELIKINGGNLVINDSGNTNRMVLTPDGIFDESGTLVVSRSGDFAQTTTRSSTLGIVTGNTFSANSFIGAHIGDMSGGTGYPENNTVNYTPTNYIPAGATSEGHLIGVDTALGSAGVSLGGWELIGSYSVTGGLLEDIEFSFAPMREIEYRIRPWNITNTLTPNTTCDLNMRVNSVTNYYGAYYNTRSINTHEGAYVINHTIQYTANQQFDVDSVTIRRAVVGSSPVATRYSPYRSMTVGNMIWELGVVKGENISNEQDNPSNSGYVNYTEAGWMSTNVTHHQAGITSIYIFVTGVVTNPVASTMSTDWGAGITIYGRAL